MKKEKNIIIGSLIAGVVVVCSSFTTHATEILNYNNLAVARTNLSAKINDDYKLVLTGKLQDKDAEQKKAAEKKEAKEKKTAEKKEARQLHHADKKEARLKHGADQKEARQKHSAEKKENNQK